MTDAPIYYNDDPVLEVGLWRILCPNMFGMKYKGRKNPLLVHKCSEYSENPEGDKWGTIMISEHPEGNPHCGHCNDPVPEEIQGLLALYY